MEHTLSTNDSTLIHDNKQPRAVHTSPVLIDLHWLPVNAHKSSFDRLTLAACKAANYFVTLLLTC